MSAWGHYVALATIRDLESMWGNDFPSSEILQTFQAPWLRGALCLRPDRATAGERWSCPRVPALTVVPWEMGLRARSPSLGRKQPQSVHPHSGAPCHLGEKTRPDYYWVGNRNSYWLKLKPFVLDFTKLLPDQSRHESSSACLERGQLFNVERAEVRRLARGSETAGPRFQASLIFTRVLQFQQAPQVCSIAQRHRRGCQFFFFSSELFYSF